MIRGTSRPEAALPRHLYVCARCGLVRSHHSGRRRVLCRDCEDVTKGDAA